MPAAKAPTRRAIASVVGQLVRDALPVVNAHSQKLTDLDTRMLALEQRPHPTTARERLRWLLTGR